MRGGVVLRTIFGNRRRPRDEESPQRGETPPQAYELLLLTLRFCIAAAVVSAVAVAACVTAPQKRGKSQAKGNAPTVLSCTSHFPSLHRGGCREYRGRRAVCHITAEKKEVPSEGKRPSQSYELLLLTLRVSIVAVLGSCAVVPHRCAGLCCPVELGMGRQCLVAPVQAPLSVRVALPVVPVVSQLTRLLPCLLVMPVRVPVRGCARVLPLKPCEGFARVVPTKPDPSPVPLVARAFSCPFVASGSWRSGYVPRVNRMIL